MEQSATARLVHTPSGRVGTIPAACLPLDAGTRIPVRFDTGEQLLIPVNFLQLREDGDYLLPLTLEDARLLWPEDVRRELVIPVVEERLVLRTRKVETGRVRITKRVATHDEDIDEPLVEETVEVERVLMNRPVDRPTPVRYEGETMIVPVFEEALVVEKRLVLKEELRITKRRSERHRPRRTTLRHEEVSVERIPARTPPEREEPDAAR